ncbi:hypothetical protein D3C75_1061150 [compost metagenome]
MAIARSLALLNADTNKGTNNGMRPFAFFIRPPLSKSAPLAVCAFIILSVSSISMGMNLKAMDIIMDISWTGAFTFFKGLKRLSKPSVR